MNKRLYCLTPQEYQRYFDSIEIVRRFEYQVKICVERIVSGMPQYIKVQEETGVPWVFVALLHEMEADCDFDRQILNGQKTNMRTTVSPKGHGPWKLWHESAKEGVERYSNVEDWTIGRMGFYLEAHNGFGYRNNGLLSPYLFRGSQMGEGLGLFASDGVYSPMLTSDQVGAYVILAEIVRQRIYSPNSEPVMTWPVMYQSYNSNVVSYQSFLNLAMELDPVLITDGISGVKTSTAHKKFTGQYLTGDPRGER